MSVQRWVGDRVPGAVVHLDVAGAGRVSTAALEAEVGHLRAEAALGPYVAEERAAPVLEAGRHALGAMLGLAGTDVAFSDGAGGAFAVLMAAWPLPRGARIGTVRSDYGGNARVLERLAPERGWELVDLPVDAQGLVTDVPDGLGLLALPQVPSQRGIAQPVDALLASGVPVLLDVAQSLGQTAVPAGCAAYVGTSRKWLCGPRGVGFLAVGPELLEQLTPPPTLAAAVHSGVRRYEVAEAHVAGRVGLAAAVQEWTPDLLPVVQGLAAHARRLLADVPGWEVVEPLDAPTGITTLRGGDPFAARTALLQRGFVTSAIPASRAAELEGPVLRVSTAAWVGEADLAAVAGALTVSG